MFSNVRTFQLFENHFKLDTIFRSLCEYQVDRVECKHITSLQATRPRGHNNLRSTDSLDCKY